MNHVLVGDPYPILFALRIMLPHLVGGIVPEVAVVVGIALGLLVRVAPGMEHVKLGPSEKFLLQVRVAGTDVLVEGGRFGSRNVCEQIIVPSGMAVIVVRSLELEAKEEGLFRIPFLQPIHRDVGIDVGGVAFPVPGTFAPAEGRIKVLALPFYDHVLVIALGLTLEVPLPDQPSLVARFVQLHGILGGIVLDAPVEPDNPVLVAVLPGQDGCPTGRAD